MISTVSVNFFSDGALFTFAHQEVKEKSGEEENP
jgi:hypothetical protein